MTSMQPIPVLIIGAGPAGYTAAIYAARAGLSPVLIAGLQPGGQLTITTDVENYPGFADPIQGPWLMEQMAAQAERMGTRVIHDIVTEVDASRRPFVCVTDSNEKFEANAIIIATGASARWLDLPSERALRGAGVSACATCDGFFYRGKDVAVIGGGNTAVEEALYLTHHARHVTLIHRRSSLRAERIMQDRLLSNPQVSVIWDHVVDEVLGAGSPAVVTSLRLKHVQSGIPREIGVDGVFVAIGHTPNTAVFKNVLDLDADGYITTEIGTTRTSVPGIFAAGDVQDRIYRQAVTAAASGCMAALDAEKWLTHSVSKVSVAAY